MLFRSDETGTATVIVSDYQLSLAIGKEGQNARLAARLTGWRIDIKSETQLAEEESGYAGEEWAEGEWIQNEAGEMVWQPAEGGSAVSATEWAEGAEGADEGASELVAEDVAESEIEAVANAVAVEEAAAVAAEEIETPATGGTEAAESAPSAGTDGEPAGEAPA